VRQALVQEVTMKVFISYSRRDDLVRSEIQHELEANGHEVWLDQSQIRGGAHWRASIENGIQETDVFVILLSPNVDKDPTHTRDELELASKYDKEIIPVHVKEMKQLPPGFDLTLGGRHYIELWHDFDEGTRRLLEVLGGPVEGAELPRMGLRDRALRSARRARIALATKDIGKKVATYGGVAVTTAAAVAVAQAEAKSRKRKEELAGYRDAVAEILIHCDKEFALALNMTPQDYAREFRPRVQRLLGRLEATAAPSEELTRRHAQLMKDLQEAVQQYDEAMDRLGQGDAEGTSRALSRLNRAWMGTLQSYAKTLGGQG
jgi:TIR domain